MSLVLGEDEAPNAGFVMLLSSTIANARWELKPPAQGGGIRETNGDDRVVAGRGERVAVSASAGRSP
jgi:hypothetical protein